MQSADGKFYKTDVGDTEQFLRLISIVSNLNAKQLSEGKPKKKLD